MSIDSTLVSIDVDVEGERTVLSVTGTRDAALIVESTSGEEIYLPPEDFDAANGDEAPGVSPYDGTPPADSPYESSAGRSSYERSDAEGGSSATDPVGVQSTADGFRVVHPEPVHDVRVLGPDET